MVYPRSILTARAMALNAALISVSEFSKSSENRIICREAADSGFIAFTTCDGSSESARHADPDEAQIPS
jgi:hypothetical protein